MVNGSVTDVGGLPPEFEGHPKASEATENISFR